jgi:hypothetical protein
MTHLKHLGFHSNVLSILSCKIHTIPHEFLAMPEVQRSHATSVKMCFLNGLIMLLGILCICCFDMYFTDALCDGFLHYVCYNFVKIKLRVLAEGYSSKKSTLPQDSRIFQGGPPIEVFCRK